MPRIRYIKPEFFVDDDIAALAPLTRLLFIGMWTLADREGRLEDRPARIKVQLMAYDDMDVEQALQDLERGRFIIRYEAEGKKLIQVRTFDKHQRIHHTEAKSRLEPPLNYDKLTHNGELTVNSRLDNGEATVTVAEGKGKGKGSVRELERESEKEMEVCVEKEGKSEGKPPRAARGNTRASLDSNLKSFEELQALILDKIPAMLDNFLMDRDRLEHFAADWLARKSLAGDWNKYQPGAMVNFFIQDATSKLTYLTRPLQKEAVKIGPN